MQFFLFLALIFAFAIVLFAVQNAEIIKLTFVTMSFEGSLALVLVLAFAAGIMTGIFLFIPTWWKKSVEGRAQRKRVQQLEEDLLNITEQGDDTAELERMENR